MKVTPGAHGTSQIHDNKGKIVTNLPNKTSPKSLGETTQKPVTVKRAQHEKTKNPLNDTLKKQSII